MNRVLRNLRYPIAVLFLVVGNHFLADSFNAGLEIVGGRGRTTTYLVWGAVHLLLAVVAIPGCLVYILYRWATHASRHVIQGIGLFFGGCALEWVLSGVPGWVVGSILPLPLRVYVPLLTLTEWLVYIGLVVPFVLLALWRWSLPRRERTTGGAAGFP